MWLSKSSDADRCQSKMHEFRLFFSFFWYFIVKLNKYVSLSIECASAGGVRFDREI